MVKNRTGHGWCTQKLKAVFTVSHVEYFQHYKSLVLNGCCDWKHSGIVLEKHEKKSSSHVETMSK